MDAGDSSSEVEGESELTPHQILSQMVQEDPHRHPLVFGLVSPLGTPIAPVEELLSESLARFQYPSVTIHLVGLLGANDPLSGKALPTRDEADYYERMMDAGDHARERVGDGSALAALAIARIKSVREKRSDEPVAFILRSLKTPEEVRLLRRVYGNAFVLVGVASRRSDRLDSLQKRLSRFDAGASEAAAVELISRDENDPTNGDFGQNVRETYCLADAYVPYAPGTSAAKEVDRVVDLIFGAPFETPRQDEEGMKLAHDASLRSSSAGRQVGAALIPPDGSPVLIGTNEVPRPGGGQFWTGQTPDHRDFQEGEDPNPVYVDHLVQDLLLHLRSGQWLREEYDDMTAGQLSAAALRDKDAPVLKSARVKALIEFTRCLHAEQAAIVNAARTGVSTLNSTLYSTTFPCHECAKFIIGAGVRRVLYIEPYPKSMVSQLYGSLIDVNPAIDDDPADATKIPFRPYVGVAPRRYVSFFTASERRAGLELAKFDRNVAAPRSTGWSEPAVSELEDTAVLAIGIGMAGVAGLQDLAVLVSAVDEATAGSQTTPVASTGSTRE